ncbi:MAG TPA: glycine--tRNA ligase subunit beta, partial [Nitrospirota bacterium]|nr:glycine--tRNA ligase subunit beta [Nitrospirota bacterium]
MQNDLLLEIGTEELPARFIPAAITGIKDAAERLLKDNRIQYREISVYGTPRRLALIVREAEEIQEDIVIEVSGPPKSAAYGADGTPTKAAVGFAKSQGIDITQLKIRSTDKGEYLFAEKHENGKRTMDVLPTLLQTLISSIVFPKSMRWNDTRVRFARPLRWLLTIYGAEVIELNFAGVSSGRISYGHHFMSPQSFVINSPDDYVSSLKERFVIADQSERRKIVEEQLKAISHEKGGRVIPDEELLKEVAYLTEYPIAVCGRFDDCFLSLPKDVLATVLREHQRSFLIEKERGEGLPYFITVSNTIPKDLDVIRSGYERVVRARLSDAKFFFDADSKVRLEDRSVKLEKVVFMAKLGTMSEKVVRLKSSVGLLSELFEMTEISPVAERSAELSKADLMTDMVGEFPELQGVMGREYALRQGEKSEVAMAIFEHYLPRFSGDMLPATKAGKILAVAEKMDNIAGCFGTGNVPTGSNDPYALRRQAIGILHILIKGGHHVALKRVAEVSLSAYKGIIEEVKYDEIITNIIEFFRERLSTLVVTEGYRYDCVRAVISADLDDPYDAFLRITALDRYRIKPEFDALTVSFKRVMNIIPPDFVSMFKEDLLKEDEEKGLYEAYRAAEEKAMLAKKVYNYWGAFSAIAELKSKVDLFFDKVLVMDKDINLRNNRISLMSMLRDLFLNFADFRQIVVEG